MTLTSRLNTLIPSVLRARLRSLGSERLLPNCFPDGGGRKKLTDKNVAALTLPVGESDLIEFDEAMPGFGVRLRRRVKKVDRPISCWQRSAARDARHHRTAEGQGEAARKGRARSRPAWQTQVAKVEQPQGGRNLRPFRLAVPRGEEEPVRPRSYSGLETFMTKHWSTFNGRSVHAIGRRDIAARLPPSPRSAVPSR